MKLKDALKEDMRKFDDVLFLYMVENFLVKSFDMLDRYDLIKILSEFNRRNFDIQKFCLELEERGEI